MTLARGVWRCCVRVPEAACDVELDRLSIYSEMAAAGKIHPSAHRETVELSALDSLALRS